MGVNGDDNAGENGTRRKGKEGELKVQEKAFFSGKGNRIFHSELGVGWKFGSQETEKESEKRRFIRKD